MTPEEEQKKLKDEGKIKALVWPDYTWCKSEYLEAYEMAGAGDDYVIFFIPEELSWDEMDRIIRESKCQDFPKKREAK